MSALLLCADTLVRAAKSFSSNFSIEGVVGRIDSIVSEAVEIFLQNEDNIQESVRLSSLSVFLGISVAFCIQLSVSETLYREHVAEKVELATTSITSVHP